jgi:TolB-like protein
MPSQHPGFEYDIFVSYRQNDNRSGWVTEFVNALQEELASTIKDPISVYFDINPHDGLLETHNIAKSLEGKLKCLIFVPILSQTYCDPRSFAWQFEFCTFNRLAREDQLGRHIELNKGNVASRILPVKIHDLEQHDTTLIENEIEEQVRAIEFIYREPGVNRPLKPADNKSDNQARIDYRNQVNKVANAVKEIILGIKRPNAFIQSIAVPAKKTKIKQSLLVLPFVNISNDPDQEYFSDGLTDEIITDLALTNELIVISRSSAMTFKGTKKKISEIADETRVDFVLEGSVRRAGKDLRITAQLINPQDDSHVWAERYNGEIDDIFGIQEKVSHAILHALKLRLSKEATEKIARRPIDNSHAYDLFLKAQYEFYTFKEDALLRSIQYLERALEIVGENTFLYGTLGLTYWNLYNIAGTSEVNYLGKAEALVKKIFGLDPDAPQGHSLAGLVAFFKGSKTEMLKHLEKANNKQANDPFTLFMLGLVYFYCGQAAEGEKVLMKVRQIDPFNPIYRTIMSLICITKGEPRLALEWSREAYRKNPEVPQAQLYYAYFLACHDHREESYPVFDKLIAENGGTIFGSLGTLLKYALQGEKSKALDFLTPEIKTKMKEDCECTWLIADGYALLNEKEESLDWLESAVKSGFINYPLFSVHDPCLKNIRGEERFKELIGEVKIAWQNFNKVE